MEPLSEESAASRRRDSFDNSQEHFASAGLRRKRGRRGSHSRAHGHFLLPFATAPLVCAVWLACVDSAGRLTLVRPPATLRLIAVCSRRCVPAGPRSMCGRAGGGPRRRTSSPTRGAAPATTPPVQRRRAARCCLALTDHWFTTASAACSKNTVCRAPSPDWIVDGPHRQSYGRSALSSTEGDRP